jgi:hypothetical protein
MKIDLKQLKGQELNADDAEEPGSVWEAYGGGGQEGRYGWVVVLGVPLFVGCACAAISWTALLKFLAFCGIGVALLGAAVIWIDSDSRPYL